MRTRLCRLCIAAVAVYLATLAYPLLLGPKAPDNVGFEDNSIEFFFLFLNKNIYYDHLLEPSGQDGSNQWSQHMFFVDKYRSCPQTVSVAISHLVHC